MRFGSKRIWWHFCIRTMCMCLCLCQCRDMWETEGYRRRCNKTVYHPFNGNCVCYSTHRCRPLAVIFDTFRVYLIIRIMLLATSWLDICTTDAPAVYITHRHYLIIDEGERERKRQEKKSPSIDGIVLIAMPQTHILIYFLSIFRSIVAAADSSLRYRII